MIANDFPPTIEGTRLGRLSRFCFDRRRLVLVSWLVALIVLNVVAGAVKGKFEDKFSGGHSQSQLAQNLLTKKFPAKAGDTANVVFGTGDSVTSPQSRAAIDRIDRLLAGQSHVVAVQGPFDPGGQAQAHATDGPFV